MAMSDKDSQKEFSKDEYFLNCFFIAKIVGTPDEMFLNKIEFSID